jgi:hypothetical protein
MAIITLKEVLAEMETGNPFSIVFITADKKRDLGGDIIRIDSCVLNWTATKEKIKADGFNPELKSKTQNHYDNGTRNLLLPAGHIKKCHIRLITEFNNKKVVY